MKEDLFLVNGHNKVQFIKLLEEQLLKQCGVSVVIAPDNADAGIVQEAVQIRSTGQLAGIVEEDVDLLVS